jgi:hypothetical protein
MICHVLNTVVSKKEAYCFVILLVSHAIWVTINTDIKIIGKGYRRNIFSMRN